MATVGKLDSYFTNIIADLMLWERQPLTRLQQQRDRLNARSNAYNEVNAKLSSLQSSVQALISTDAFNELKAGRSAAVSNVASGYTVLTASVTSAATAGAYDIVVTTLAQAQRVRSAQQAYSDQGLGLAGTLLLGGEAARSVADEVNITDTVIDFAMASIASGQKELSRGSYYVETRNDATYGWQFRLVDSAGKAVSVQQGSSDEYSADWQSIPTGGGVYDTGRGLTINFDDGVDPYQAGSRASGTAASVSYSAQGASIAIAATDSLNAIATKINSAVYSENDGVVASVVDRQLVLAAAHPGTSYSIRAQDSTGSVLQTLDVISAPNTFAHQLQSAGNAVFTVNGLSVARSQNSSLTDVISGVTLNLAPDAEGRSATLTVKADWGGARSAINGFITNFNGAIAYLEQKTALVQASTGPTPTYNRGVLADDSIFSELRGDLFASFMNTFSTSGEFDSLREIGLTIDDNLKASVSDAAKLEQALNEDFAGVVELMDRAMGGLDTLLSRFTGDGSDNSYLDSAVDGLGSQLTMVDMGIADLNTRLADREQYLYDQYAEIQSLLLSMSYTQQMWASIYGSINSLY